MNELILEQDEVLPLDVKCVYTTKEIISKISSLTTPTNIMALVRKKPVTKTFKDKILLLDNIQDPGNLGTIIRSAKAFNIDTIILSNDTVDLYNPKVLRATQGISFYMNIYQDDLSSSLEKIKEDNIVIYGTKVECGIDVKTLTTKDKSRFALVMGNEGNGLKDNITKLCDKNLYLKMNDDVESLNVAIACSILLYELGS